MTDATYDYRIGHSFCATATRSEWLELLVEALDQYHRMAPDLVMDDGE